MANDHAQRALHLAVIAAIGPEGVRAHSENGAARKQEQEDGNKDKTAQLVS